jgi:hypothetical protein
MSSLTGGTVINVGTITCNPVQYTLPTAGDFVTIYYDNLGSSNCSCENLPTPTPTAVPSPIQTRYGDDQKKKIDNLNRLIKTESGGRDYNKDGTPVESEKGARYKYQVMPATAHKPGFGIDPVRDESPEEYNRVGQEYYDAMYKKYNGDLDKVNAA